ncbi:glucan phosphorylase [Streptomyces sp. MJP52]|nr:glucan phosphorylase [Streptomyces sp. MJP52]
MLDPNELPLAPLARPDGTPAHVSLALPGGTSLRARIWLAQVGRVPLLLLDSDVEDNGAGERCVTDRLYGGGSEHRLLQEMLLGIGGVRAVREYCELTGHPRPEVFHTNEGHAGFLGLERIHELVTEGLDFDAALEAVRAGTVFTTHTPPCRPASTGSTATWSPASSGRTPSCRGSTSTGCCGWAPRPTPEATRASSTWR